MDLRKENSEEIIFLLMDNISSHKADAVKNLSKELNIELCYLHPYLPRLQPIEKNMVKIKRDNMKYKIDYIKNFARDKDEKLELLKNIVEKQLNLKKYGIKFQ